jgi:hypothetical protein
MIVRIQIFCSFQSVFVFGGFLSPSLCGGVDYVQVWRAVKDGLLSPKDNLEGGALPSTVLWPKPL